MKNITYNAEYIVIEEPAFQKEAWKEKNWFWSESSGSWYHRLCTQTFKDV